MIMDINSLIYPIKRPGTAIYNPVLSEMVFLHKGRNDFAEYVEAHLRQLNEYANTARSRKLIHLPQVVKEIYDNGKHTYYFPDLTGDETQLTLDVEAIWNMLCIPAECRTALILGCAEIGDVFVCSLDTVLPSDIDCVIEEFCHFLQNYDSKNYVRNSATTSFYDMFSRDERDFADDEFENEVNRLSEEIVANVNRLRAIGISEVVIRQLFEREQKLSRLIFTEDYKIILPDYNNMEIKMEPLPKAVYMLFLSHPEGIRFKDLPCYREELARMYLNVTDRNDLHAAYQSILNVTDPTKNSINEKCSRIKEAFISRFDDNLASYYYITGLAGEKKGVRLSRQLVSNNNKLR